ncbi:MAG: isocitrate lyase/phosphoenolpyruvate mutase family protein [Pirellulales bacterium]
MQTQEEKGSVFRQMHERKTAFLIPNPWDVGTAVALAHLGFEALATTSAGFAFSAGKRDNQVGREETLAHAGAIASATDLPVSADLAKGFGDDPDTVAETIRLAAATGLVGGSIEDSTGRRDDPIYEDALAVERVRAAAEVTRSLPFTFMLTARCENYLVGRPDLTDTIKRLEAYQEAGADVLYAPGITSKEDIAAVVSSVDRPVNVLVGLRGVELSLADLSALGVRRVSIGSGLYRAAFGGFLRAAREMHEHGTFSKIADEPVSFGDISALF